MATTAESGGGRLGSLNRVRSAFDNEAAWQARSRRDTLTDIQSPRSESVSFTLRRFSTSDPARPSSSTKVRSVFDDEARDHLRIQFGELSRRQTGRPR